MAKQGLGVRPKKKAKMICIVFEAMGVNQTQTLCAHHVQESAPLRHVCWVDISYNLATYASDTLPRDGLITGFLFVSQNALLTPSWQGARGQ